MVVRNLPKRHKGTSCSEALRLKLVFEHYRHLCENQCYDLTGDCLMDNTVTFMGRSAKSRFI